ncbi:MAG: peptidylprolyl isomerase [Patescibacteria group bacterium]
MTVVWHHEHHVHERHVAPERSRIVWWALGAVVILSVVAGGGWFFWKGWRSGSFPAILERTLFVPIGFEDGHVLWFSSVARLARGIAAADGRSAVSEADYAQAIDAMVRRHALEDIASEEHVNVSNADVSAAVEWTDDIRSFETLAGWSDGEYLKYIQRSFVLSTAVQSALHTSEVYQAGARDRIADIQAKLTLGIAFEDVAKEYSEDPATAQIKGSFGYVLPSEVDATFAPAFLLPTNTVSDVIVTSDAYWLLRIEDAVTDDSGTRYLLRGIAIKKGTLADILDERTSGIAPSLWVR